MEADTVAYCGATSQNEVTRTLTMTDLVTGWGERPGHRGIDE